MQHRHLSALLNQIAFELGGSFVVAWMICVALACVHSLRQWLNTRLRVSRNQQTR